MSSYWSYHIYLCKHVHLYITEYYNGIFLPQQGLMFGYASDETKEGMPLTIMLAHKLNAKLSELRRNGTFPWAGPDTKTQLETQLISVLQV
ncbi:UNVERIFIED_CONTAM: Mat2a [Trichonephila clavipes]